MAPGVRNSGAVNILDVEGRLTAGSPRTDELGMTIRDLLHTGRKKILLNLEEVSYIDSGSLGLLIAHYKRAVERNGVIKLLKPNDKILHILTSTKLDHVFEVFEDEGDAVSSF